MTDRTTAHQTTHPGPRGQAPSWENQPFADDPRHRQASPAQIALMLDTSVSEVLSACSRTAPDHALPDAQTLPSMNRTGYCVAMGRTSAGKSMFPAMNGRYRLSEGADE